MNISQNGFLFVLKASMKSTKIQDYKIKHYRGMAAAWFFIILCVEFGLAYLPIEKIGLLSQLTLILESRIPSIWSVANEKARIYMVTTLIFIPLKLWNAYTIGTITDNCKTEIPLPSKKNKITLRMIICFIALLSFFGYAIYLTFIEKFIGDVPYMSQHEQNYSAFVIWYEWSFYRLGFFCIITVVVFTSIKAYFKYFMYLISKDYYKE